MTFGEFARQETKKSGMKISAETKNAQEMCYWMIASTEYCSRVVPVMKPETIQNEYLRIIAGWVKQFYEQYKKAPRYTIRRLFNRAEKDGEFGDNEVLLENTRVFCSKALARFEKFEGSGEQEGNLQFEVDSAVEYLEKCNATYFAKRINECVDSGNCGKVAQLVREYKEVRLVERTGVNVKNVDVIQQAFREEKRVLFRYDGAFGNVVGDVQRGDLIAVASRAKGGKSHCLMHMAVKAALKGQKVLYFNLEMERNMLYRRAAGAMYGACAENRSVELPVFAKNSNGEWVVEYEEKRFEAFDDKKFKKRSESFQKHCRGGGLYLVTHPTNTLTIDDIELELEVLKNDENFVPDVVVVDYADIMLMRPAKGDGGYRHELDSIWKNLRGLAVEYDIAVITATQVGRSKQEGKPSGPGDVAEDIRKIATATSVLFINDVDNPGEYPNVKKLSKEIARDDEAGKACYVTCDMGMGIFCNDSRMVWECAIEKKGVAGRRVAPNKPGGGISTKKENFAGRVSRGADVAGEEKTEGDWKEMGARKYGSKKRFASYNSLT